MKQIINYVINTVIIVIGLIGNIILFGMILPTILNITSTLSICLGLIAFVLGVGIFNVFVLTSIFIFRILQKRWNMKRS